MPSAFSIPKVYEQEIEAVIVAGYYSNKSEVVRDALRNLFEEKTNLRLAAAVEMYKGNEVTLSKGAEIACLNILEFKDLLHDRGIKIRAPKESRAEIARGVYSIKRLRKAK
ncbi:UPF0175 family protein [Candidatus Woesearchaeota archaeon]|nr:UPF0175 family protein [Candidatus Woesearchaeota archaeon]